MKICITCKIPKSLDEFGHNSRHADGKHKVCRSCWNTYVNDRRYAQGVKPMSPFLTRLWGNIWQCGHEDVCLYCCWPWQKALDADGYGHISLSYNGHSRPYPVPRIVYEVWNGIRLSDDQCACHYCDNPSCGNPLHIWAGTSVQNRLDCVQKGRQSKGLLNGRYTHPESTSRGEQHVRAKLTTAQVLEIRAAHAQGTSMLKLAQRFGVTDAAIFAIIHRKSWKHV